MGHSSCLDEALPFGEESWVFDDFVILEIRAALKLRDGRFWPATREEDVGVTWIKSTTQVFRVVRTHLAVATKLHCRL